MNKNLYTTCGLLLTVILIALVFSYIPFFKTNEGFEEGIEGNTTAQGATIVSRPLRLAAGARTHSLINHAKKLKNRANSTFTSLSSDNKIKFRNIIKDILANT